MKIKNTEINYCQYGLEGGPHLVLLPGWGQNISVMDLLGQYFKANFKVTIIDLPGFGESSEPPKPWDLKDYYETVVLLLKKLKVSNPIMIGHSFGGRIAIMYGAEQETRKLVLLAAPFRPQITKIKKLKVKVYKTLKRIPIIKNYENYFKTKIGSRDYRNSSAIMRGTLVNVVNTDLTAYLSKIKCPTLLIWGSKDQEVSINEAHYLEETINNCGLVVYEGCGHYAFLDHLGQTVAILNKFLEKERT